MVVVNGKHFTVIYTDESEGFSVQAAELLGCISEGKTRKEATANIKEAIQGYIEAFPDEFDKSKQQ